MQTTAGGSVMETEAPRTVSGRVAPNELSTRTQVFGGEETLLVEQPAAVG